MTKPSAAAAGPVTMRDIASRVGVSQATVSYVLSGRRSGGVRVREEMRDRILQTARDMGYRRNALARAVASGKTCVLAFLTRIPDQESSARLMLGAQEEAAESGYLIQLQPLLGRDDYAESFARLVEQRPMGVLTHNLKANAVEILHRETRRFGIPVVMLDDPPPQTWAARVVSDDENGIRLALEHLAALGHRRIAFLGAQRDSPLAETRREAFLRQMATLELPVPDAYLAASDWTKEHHIAEGVRALLSPPYGRLPPPTALMCAGDVIAMIAQRLARGYGFSVPRDLSVVGWADFSFSAYADPPLTTVAQPYEEMGREAVRCLLRQERGDGGGLFTEGAAPVIRLPERLVVRESTATVTGG